LSNLIVFSGTDGSGKSTQIKLLINDFNKQGFSTKYIWSRGGYTPLFSSLKKIFKVSSAIKTSSLGKNNFRKKLLKKKWVSKIWLTMATLDLIIFYVVYIRMISQIRDIIICDRYIEDTFIDFKRNFPETFNEYSFLWKLLVLLAPSPNKSFLLFVPVNISLERSKMKEEPFPDTSETLAFRLKAYLDESIFSSHKYHKIDCQSSIQKINIKIKEKFKELS